MCVFVGMRVIKNNKKKTDKLNVWNALWFSISRPQLCQCRGRDRLICKWECVHVECTLSVYLWTKAELQYQHYLSWDKAGTVQTTVDGHRLTAGRWHELNQKSSLLEQRCQLEFQNKFGPGPAERSMAFLMKQASVNAVCRRLCQQTAKNCKKYNHIFIFFILIANDWPALSLWSTCRSWSTYWTPLIYSVSWFGDMWLI